MEFVIWLLLGVIIGIFINFTKQSLNRPVQFQLTDPEDPAIANHSYRLFEKLARASSKHGHCFKFAV